MSNKNKKIGAIAAGALVVGLGLTYTLATWNDSEWVWGGANDRAGIGSSSFNVQQNTTNPYAEGMFGDFESNPGAGLAFSPGALALSPGESVYAPVALRTSEDSVAGEVTLQPAVSAFEVPVNDEDDKLWDAMTVTVYTAAGDTAGQQPPGPCAPEFTSDTWTELVANAPLGAEVANGSEALEARAGSVQHYCFVLTLPEDAQVESNKDLMGRTIAPAWEFTAVSVVE